jgi:hypothetical protein
MQLDVILRGQSNAAFLAELDGYAGAGALVAEVERLLGFDGTTQRVNLVYDRDGQGGDTVYPATAFLGDWMETSGGSWVPGEYEQKFLDRMAEYRTDGMGDASLMVWLHSEYDSRNPDLSTADWTAAVRSDAALVRGELGREMPYLFVAAQPYGDGTDAGHQAIRAGMEQLAADPGFDAGIAARAPDIDLSLDDRDGDWGTTEYGGGHIGADDAVRIAERIGRSVAQEWAAFAQPGSPVARALGQVTDDGPQVVAATQVAPGQLQVDVVQDGVDGFLPFGAGAAAGFGWSAALPDGRRITASSAEVLDGDSLLLGFAQALPEGAVLDYAWGIGRTAAPEGPGAGNAVLDLSGLPAWTPAQGVAVNGDVWP